MPARNVQTIDRAIALLWVFVDDGPELGVTEVAQKLSLHKSTASRLLTSLAANRLVSQNPETRKYRLGPGVLELAGRVLEEYGIRRIARPYLVELAGRTGETVNLVVLDSDGAINIDQIVGTNSTRNVGWIGRRNPLHCTAVGKAALAYLPEAERERYLAGPLQPMTSFTITDPAVIREQLTVVRIRGYADARDEVEEGLSAVAAPILDDLNRLVGIIGITWVSYRVPPDRRSKLGAEVRATAFEISRLFGVGAPINLNADGFSPNL